MSMVAATLLVALAATAARAPGFGPSAASAPLAVVLGDSLTSGKGIGEDRAFPAILQRRIDDEGLRLRVVNAGVSGATSADGLRRLRAAIQGDVRVLVVALGANDGLRGVPVERLKANLSAIISQAQERRISVLLCGMDALPIYGWPYSLAFHRVYQELADEFQVPLVPFMLRGVIGNPAMMQRDRAHPNADGARAIAENIWPYLEPLVREVAQDR